MVVVWGCIGVKLVNALFYGINKGIEGIIV
jgi:hypothetical protein